MSAVFDHWKDEVQEREEAGFSTLWANSAGLPLEGTLPSFTTSGSVSTVREPSGALVATYGLSRDRRSERGYGRGRSATVHPGDFLLHWYDESTATARLFTLDFEPSQERGVVVLDVPRQMVHSESVEFYTSRLPRKAPRVIFLGRDHGEGNA